MTQETYEFEGQVPRIKIFNFGIKDYPKLYVLGGCFYRGINEKNYSNITSLDLAEGPFKDKKELKNGLIEKISKSKIKLDNESLVIILKDIQSYKI
ncbi:MAG: hypothetical protein AABW45_01830 [Nanoarchaeota archaeon]